MNTTNLSKKPKFGIISSIIPVSLHNFSQAVRASLAAKSIEIRFDRVYKGLEGFNDMLLHFITNLFVNSGITAILTLRSKEDRGADLISIEDQWKFWCGLPKELKDVISDPNSKVYVDWSIELVLYALGMPEQLMPFPWSKIGCSFHDFYQTRNDLPEILAVMQTYPTQAFLKVVPTVVGDEDLAIIEGMARTYQDERPLITFGMGEPGRSSRKDCFEWGCQGTFGYPEEHCTTAPGQFSIEELLADEKVQAGLAGKFLKN